MPSCTVQSELPRAKSSALPVRSVRDSVALSAAQLKLESSYRRPWSSNCRGGGAGRPRSPPPPRFRRGTAGALAVGLPRSCAPQTSEGRLRGLRLAAAVRAPPHRRGPTSPPQRAHGCALSPPDPGARAPPARSCRRVALGAWRARPPRPPPGKAGEQGRWGAGEKGRTGTGVVGPGSRGYAGLGPHSRAPPRTARAREGGGARPWPARGGSMGRDGGARPWPWRREGAGREKPRERGRRGVEGWKGRERKKGKEKNKIILTCGSHIGS